MLKAMPAMRKAVANQLLTCTSFDSQNIAEAGPTCAQQVAEQAKHLEYSWYR
jgi:hypothetical protein